MSKTISFDDFVWKYNGKFVDFDGQYGYQCVDLIRKYLVEVLGIDGYSLPAVGYAKQLFTNFNDSNNYFFKIKNVWSDLNCQPKKGDIVIWGYHWGVTGWAGHVAICGSADGKNIVTFDQNYPSGTPCKLIQHSYRGVLGWLRFKK